ncbi:MAG: cytochrome c-type biogenesis CcmF C-terminal domain-containing protein, partial [Chloroflexota bacterium]
LSVGGYQLRLEGLRRYPGSDGRDIVEADVQVQENGRQVSLVQPRQDYFIVQEQPVTVPGVYATAGKDVYVLLVGWELAGDTVKSATFKIYVNSLINWVWIGGLLMILGTIIGTWSGPAGREATYVFRPVSLTTIPANQEA